MPLSRDEVGPGLEQELTGFAELILSLSDSEWEAPTRCEGWRSADVAAHVIGTMTDVVNGRIEGLGTPERLQGQVDERRGRTQAQLAEELEQSGKVARDMLGAFDEAAWNSPVPGFDGTVGFGVEALWYDAFVHADDIRSAIGRPSEQGPGLKAAVSHIAAVLENQGYAPVTIALDGVDEFKVGDGSAGRITGDPMQFVLAATGRGDPAAFGAGPELNIYRPQ